MKRLLNTILIGIVMVMGVWAQSSITDEVLNLIDTQTTGLERLVADYDRMKELSQTVLRDNEELKTIIDRSGDTINSLQTNLEVAQDRITDAEGGAIALLDENTKLWEDNVKKDVKIAKQGGTIARMILVIVLLSLAILTYVALRLLKANPQTRMAFLWVP